MSHAPDWDLVVAGAGPAGSIAAREAARRGLRCLLLDARKFPRLKPCAGGISPRARGVLRRLGLWDKVAAAAYEIQGIRLGGPSGRETTLVGAGSAVVLDRPRLDALLAAEAVAAGATFHDGQRVLGAVREGGRVAGVRTDAGDARARWVVAADGANTRFSTDPRPRHVLHSCMAWFAQFPFRPHVLQMFFDADLAPHYAWLFPEADDRVNVGLCVEADRHTGTPIREVFRRFLERHYAAELSRARPLGEWRGHPLVVTDSIEHHAAPGVLLAGEACRLVNPATGEGISYAMESGRLAADFVADALRDREAPLATAKRYERSLRWHIEPGLRGGELFRRWGIRLIDPLVRLGQNPWFRKWAKQAPVGES
ncbi:MAG: NAD(P)/FAD-dependent oxidoreductase [Deltaproteobacteria bacterium]|nr:NAD(P)/FAD-dependent oxidoreductase [Deltaproteobacteria bacterium]